MSFKDQLAEFTAAEIVAALNCPRATAYQWKDGRREPPEWQRAHWVELIERKVKQARKRHG